MSKLHLQNQNYRLAMLAGADLHGANLEKKDLRGAQLKGANLSKAQLHDANLGAADLRKADLSSADLSNCDLGGADLRGANLTDAKMNNVELFAAKLKGSQLPDKLAHCKMQGIDLQETNLSKIDFHGTNFRSAKLYRSSLIGCNLNGCNLENANLREANLESVSLKKAHLKNTNMLFVNFDQTDIYLRTDIDKLQQNQLSNYRKEIDKMDSPFQLQNFAKHLGAHDLLRVVASESATEFGNTYSFQQLLSSIFEKARTICLNEQNLLQLKEILKGKFPDIEKLLAYEMGHQKVNQEISPSNHKEVYNEKFVGLFFKTSGSSASERSSKLNPVSNESQVHIGAGG